MPMWFQHPHFLQPATLTGNIQGTHLSGRATSTAEEK